MTSLDPPARYFPVTPRPYRMKAGLAPFGGALGNGERDAMYFQMDCEREAYLASKRAAPPTRHWVRRRPELDPCHEAVRRWMIETLVREHPELGVAAAADYEAIAHQVQEDFVVIHRPADGRDETIASYAYFPSGWRPERIAGAGFKEIHGPVPGFAEQEAVVASMVATMVERGPYVRFLWTIAADDELDHHPEEGWRRPWGEADEGWLRVERQVTVPFPEVSTSLFLIRTYLYPFSSLSAEQRRDLATALELMPEDVARYKGLDGAVRNLARALLREEIGTADERRFRSARML